MGVDIRLPIGGMFAFLGLLLILYGLLTNGDPMYSRSLHLNANLWWGLAMLAFGAIMLYLGRPKQNRTPAP